MASESWGGQRARFAAGRTAFVVLVAALVSLASDRAHAQRKERSGKEVVESVCAACHRTGEKGAPKIGDEKAWSKLAQRGLTSLTESALKGIRNMPAHGGNPGLSDIEIERAIVYMVNQSGGRWVEPVGGITPAEERRGEEIVKAQCAKCHETGEGGAPKIGDREAWIPRLRRGLELLVRSAIHGHGPMPPRGGMADLTDSEIRSAIVYMFNPRRGAPEQPPKPAPSLPKGPDLYHASVGGLEVYLGVMSAERIRSEFPKDSPESKMHGGIPRGRGYYHVTVSLYDRATKAPVTDARVEATVAEPTGVQTKPLERITLGSVTSYGNYFRMPTRNPYRITVRINRPGDARPLETSFDYRP
jgi:cytochrome c5